MLSYFVCSLRLRMHRHVASQIVARYMHVPEMTCFGAGPPISEVRAAKRFPLLAPSLEGLRRFAHLISVEYFSDLLAVMVQVAAAPGLPARMRLHVLLTASDILKCVLAVLYYWSSTWPPLLLFP